MFKNAADRDNAWEGVVKDKSRSSPDGRSFYHALTVVLDNGTTKKVQVPGRFWTGVSAGDRVVKRCGDDDPRTA